MSALAVGPLRLAVLGQVRALGQDGVSMLPVSGLGANLLLALALGPGRGLSTSRAVEDTWPEGAPSSGRAALQTLVSRLRATHATGLLTSTATGYALGCGAEEVDLLRAADVVGRARAALAAPGADAVAAAELTGTALDLWTGEPGTGVVSQELVEALRSRADTVRRDLLRVRAGALLLLGDAAAVAASEELLGLAPLDDGAHLLRMRALHAAGRTTEAVAAFADYRARLRDTLGTDPSAEVAAFHLQLLDGTALPAPAQRLAASGTGRAPHAAPEAEEPVRPAPAPPSVHGLRAAPTALIGREDDIVRVEALLGTTPVVTLLGAGGLGKTRLAQEVARRAVGRYAAVYVVELASVRQGADVTAALAAALGVAQTAPRRAVPDKRPRSLQDRVLGQLDGQPTLLVLDNCEHLLADVGQWVSDIVAAAPGVQVLTTSRAPLGVAGERVHPLEPLPVGDADAPGPAVRLFTERATAVRPTVALPPGVVERLCARLDGLPLAIELAAARTRSLTVEEVERRLSDRFALLVGGSTSVPERHRTLHAVIEWSWDLLTERQRVLCRRVAAFPDGFTAEAAQYLAPAGAAEIAVLDDLDALVGQSLLRAEEHRSTGTMRYRMLETVREFGERETRAAGDGDTVRHALLDWGRDVCAQIVARSESPDRILLDPAGEAEHDNLVALLREALAAQGGDGPRPDAVAALYAVLGPRWLLQGAQEELGDIQADVLAAVRGWGPTPDLVDVLVVSLAVIAVTEPLFGDVRTGARARPALRRAVACPPGPSPLPAMLAQMALALARPRDAERVLARARSSDLLPLRRFALLTSGMLAENDGEIEAAIAHATAAFDLAVQGGETWSQVMAASSVASAFAQSLRPREALEWVETGMRMLEGLGGTLEHSAAGPLAEGLEQTRGFALLALGRHDAAEEVFARMVANGGQRHEPVLLGKLGIAESVRRRGDTERGLALMRDLVRQAEATLHGDPWLLLVLSSSVAAHALAGRTDAPGVARSADRLVETLMTGRGTNPMFTDRPVLGTTLVSVAAWRTATAPEAGTGLELLALAEQLQSRQDLPSTLRATHWAVAERVYGAASVAQARAEAAALPRHQQLPRATDLLRAG